MIFEQVKKLVADQFAVDEDSINEDTLFVDDLGADSLDIVELTMTLEEEFGLPETNEEELVKLVSVGALADYVASKVD